MFLLLRQYIQTSPWALPLRWLRDFLRISNTRAGLRTAQGQIDWLEQNIARLEQNIAQLEQNIAQLEQRFGEQDRQYRIMERDLRQVYPLVQPGTYPFAWQGASPVWMQNAQQQIGCAAASLAPVQKQEAFYTYYSEMGGDNRSILHQQYAAYLPLLPPSAQPLLDIGCGAGEFLAYLKSHGISAKGIDLSASEVARARAAGLDAEQASAQSYLASSAQTYSAIALLQVIEHIPAQDMLALLQQCVERLAPGAALLAETINLRHPLAVNGFYTDPTHQRPVSDNYLGFIFQWLNLENVQLLYTLPERHPGIPVDDYLRIYTNYTVIGYKPQPSDG